MAELTDQERAWSDGGADPALPGAPQAGRGPYGAPLLRRGAGSGHHGLIQTLLDQGKTVCLPKCLPEYQMEARAITSLEDLVPTSTTFLPQGRMSRGGQGGVGPHPGPWPVL